MDNPDLSAAHQNMPVDNNILAEYSSTRLFLRRGTGNSRICEIYDSAWLPKAEAVFAILSDGIGDFKE
jgi:DNA repair protein RAD51